MVNIGKVLKTVNKQSGVWKNKELDKSIVAMKPGKRISRNDVIYWETRKNRSDLKNNL
jgi:hypothetical protein